MFAAEIKKLRDEFESSTRTMQTKRARDKADNDKRHSANEKELRLHLGRLDDHETNFESIASVTTMLIENINMQMEAEICDM
jgi:hypothetical protein